MLPIKIHTSWFGHAGYNSHARGFVRSLVKYYPNLLVRSFTSLKEYPDPPVVETDKPFLSETTLKNTDGSFSSYSFPWNSNILDNNTKEEKIHIILQPTEHPYYYEKYNGIKIAYNVWETTRQPDEFFELLLTFDQLWVPTEWQKKCLIEQGYPSEKLFIVNEAIDEDLFYVTNIIPAEIDGRFKFMVFGKWEYRKSTEEIVHAFLDEFNNDEPVDLIISADNPYAYDGIKSTSNKLKLYNIYDNQVKAIRFPDRSTYINLLRYGNVLISCSRSEGWGIPQIESMAIGTPTIITNYGAQLEYGLNFPLKVNIYDEENANLSQETQNIPGKWCSPDFEHLQKIMRDCYENYSQYKKLSLKLSHQVIKRFVWENVAKQARYAINQLSISQKNTFKKILFVTSGDEKFFPIIDKLAKSIKLFSKYELVVYGVGDISQISFAHCKQIDIDIKIPTDKWYIKQRVCMQAIEDYPGYDAFIWIDGDSIVNDNVDNITKYVDKVLNYPLCDRHVFNQYYTFFNKELERKKRRTFFNEHLIKEFEIERNNPILAHACFFLFNKECKWFFKEVISTYENLKQRNCHGLCVWNDEGIHNLLMWKYNFREFLPQSNFESGFNPDRIEDFFKRNGPFNFKETRGWNFIPENKNQIVYFHGNKDIKQADKIINLIQQSKKITNDDFYTLLGIRNFRQLNMQGPVWEIGAQYNWYAAIYHEIYNLHEYDFIPEVKINQNDRVLDVGGHIGIFARYCIENGAGTVWSIEPDPDSFYYLKKNVSEKCQCFNCGIWSSNNIKTLNQTSHAGGSTFLDTKEGLSTKQVNCFTLNHFFDAGLFDEIDYMKIDAEGAEIEILSGITDQNLIKIKKIAIEFHNCFWEDGETKRQKIIDRFTQLNFKTYTLFMGNNDKLQMLYLWKY